MRETGKTVMATPLKTTDQPEEATTAVRAACVRVSHNARRMVAPMFLVATILKPAEVIVLATPGLIRKRKVQLVVMVKMQETISAGLTRAMKIPKVIVRVADTSAAKTRGASAELTMPVAKMKAVLTLPNMLRAIVQKVKVAIALATTKVDMAVKVMHKVPADVADTIAEVTDSVPVVAVTTPTRSIATRSAWNTRRKTTTPTSLSV